MILSKMTLGVMSSFATVSINYIRYSVHNYTHDAKLF
jgi:hypothetical protein